jgi:hypothetical protein
LSLLGILIVSLLSTVVVAEARICKQIFIPHQPRQQTEFYISKDLYHYNRIKDEFLSELNKAEVRARSEEEGPLAWHARESKRILERFRKQLVRYSKNRIKKQVQRIHEYRIFEDPTPAQEIATKKILDHIDRIRSYMLEQHHLDKVTESSSLHRTKNQYKLIGLKYLQQHEFLTVYTHALMHQFFEITSLRGSHPEEAIPVTYRSIGWKHEEDFKKMWNMINNTPEADYFLSDPSQWRGNELADRTDRFIEEMGIYLKKVEKAVYKFGMDKQFSLNDIKKKFNSFREKADLLNHKIRHQIITQDDYIKPMTDLAKGFTGHVQSHLGEIWVLSRLPLQLGHFYKANVRGGEILKDQETKGLEVNRHHRKEFDIYSVFEVFGQRIHMVGEVKLFNRPLYPAEKSRPLQNIKRQIILSHQIMKQLKPEKYEIHFFIIRGLHIDVKNELEKMGAIIHGPVFQD